MFKGGEEGEGEGGKKCALIDHQAVADGKNNAIAFVLNAALHKLIRSAIKLYLC